ncbi:hypothetical protein SAMN04488239_12166 [Ruegeria marina]|uniref:Uncharacterized protein n=1 Tax=Ruegeria marina TaxID=639004 RepID=A0A1G7DKB9_9RHOB|nr:hypothetical protein SAMN04488239_12166 [Ruegeria marina]
MPHPPIECAAGRKDRFDPYGGADSASKPRVFAFGSPGPAISWKDTPIHFRLSKKD